MTDAALAGFAATHAAARVNELFSPAAARPRRHVQLAAPERIKTLPPPPPPRAKLAAPERITPPPPPPPRAALAAPERMALAAPERMTPRRDAAAVAARHGHLVDGDLAQLQAATGYSRRELFELHARYQALVAVSADARGVDVVAFRRGQLPLAIEDAPFAARVFALLDANANARIEFGEFLTAAFLLDKGSREARADFLFRVVDADGSGSLERSELYACFLAGLRMRAPPAAHSAEDGVLRAFSDQIFDAASGGGGRSQHIAREDVYRFLAQRPDMDVPSVFGRSLLAGRDVRALLARAAAAPVGAARAAARGAAAPSQLRAAGAAGGLRAGGRVQQPPPPPPPASRRGCPL